MGTLGTIASGSMSNLIHRAASVALKEERKLVLMPRETPLSRSTSRTCCACGAPAPRSSSSRPASTTAPGEALRVEDLVDFIVGRCLDQLGLENALIPRWGES